MEWTLKLAEWPWWRSNHPLTPCFLSRFERGNVETAAVQTAQWHVCVPAPRSDHQGPAPTLWRRARPYGLELKVSRIDEMWAVCHTNRICMGRSQLIYGSAFVSSSVPLFIFSSWEFQLASCADALSSSRNDSFVGEESLRDELRASAQEAKFQPD